MIPESGKSEDWDRPIDVDPISRSAQETFERQLAGKFPEICREITRLVKAIVAIVGGVNRLKLLQRLYSDLVLVSLGKSSEYDYVGEDHIPGWALHLCQIYISSTPYLGSPDPPDIGEEEYGRLKSLIAELRQNLVAAFFPARTMVMKRRRNFDLDRESFVTQIQLLATFVRGKRYLVHEKEFHERLLHYQDAIIREKFSIGVDAIVEGLAKIGTALTEGLGDAILGMKLAHKDVIKALIGNQDLKRKIDAAFRVSTEEGKKAFGKASAKLAEELGHTEALERFKANFLGTDLFDVMLVTGWPNSIIETLSTAEGTDTEFFNGRHYPGWPVKKSALNTKPLLKLNGRSYCFDIYTLFDAFYRSLENSICSDDSSRSRWAEAQKLGSEEFVSDIFSTLLPGCIATRSVYFDWADPGVPGLLKRTETDLIVEYGDMLFVVETKAGAFTKAPPLTGSWRSAWACRCSLCGGRPGGRRGIPALPFCSVVLTAKKPANPMYPKNLVTLGDHIRKVRLDQGFFQKDVAKVLGVSVTAVSGWEKNWRTPQPAYHRAIVTFLGYDPGQVHPKDPEEIDGQPLNPDRLS